MRKKILATLLALVTLCGATPVLGADLTETSETGTQMVPISYTKEPSFTVQLPKRLKLADLKSGKQSVTYNINVKGELASNQSVVVKPSSEVNVKNSISLDTDVLDVNQSKTEFFAGDISSSSGQTTSGTIAGNLGVGKWNGQLSFTVSMGIHQHDWVYSGDTATCSVCKAKSTPAVVPVSSQNDENFMNSGIAKSKVHELYIENAYTAGNVTDTFNVTDNQSIVGWVTDYGSAGEKDVHIAPSTPVTSLKAPQDSSYLFAGIKEISSDGISLYFGDTTTMSHAFENVKVSGLILSDFDNVTDFTSAFAGSNINIGVVTAEKTDNMYNKNTSHFASKISTKNIGNGTFAYMSNMGTTGDALEITADTIDSGAFFAAGNLQSNSSHNVTSDTIHYSSIVLNGVKTMTGQALFSDIQSKNIVFNTKELHSIPTACFYYNYDLTTLDIPNDINSAGDLDIGQAAFSGCSALTSVKFPTSMSKIEAGAFAGCTKLETVILPDTFTKIEAGAFSGAPIKSIKWKNHTYTSLADFKAALSENSYSANVEEGAFMNF